MAEAYFNVIGYAKHKDLRKFTSEQLFEEYGQRLTKNPFYICKRACGATGNKRSQWKTEVQIK